jgi:hypothetical protein
LPAKSREKYRTDAEKPASCAAALRILTPMVGCGAAAKGRTARRTSERLAMLDVTGSFDYLFRPT